MREALAAAPPWYVAGPAIGLVVVAFLALTNQRLGVVGGYDELVRRTTGRTRSLGWKASFLLGIVAGGALFAALADVWRAAEGYGWLSRAFGAEGDAAVASFLLVGGLLIGYGAKTAGGCTSGNGLAGCSLGSPASFVATMTLMTAAVATAFLTRALFGS